MMRMVRMVMLILTQMRLLLSMLMMWELAVLINPFLMLLAMALRLMVTSESLASFPTSKTCSFDAGVLPGLIGHPSPGCESRT